MEPKEYTVERVEDMRTVKGRKEYYLKWKGYPSTLNSWEPLDKLNCMELIASFEESQKKKVIKKNLPLKASKAKFKNTKNNISKARTIISKDDDGPKEEEITPVLTTLQPLKILGATDASGELMFLIQWNRSDHADLVAAKLANIQWPQLVIKFYEERLWWHDV